MSFQDDIRMAQRIKELYPPGTRIVLNHMSDPYAPVEPGTRGTVQMVDDAGTIHPIFDNGRSLGIIPSEDSFRKLTDEELAEEAANQTALNDENTEDEGMSPTM